MIPSELVLVIAVLFGSMMAGAGVTVMVYAIYMLLKYYSGPA
ncbi:hypothetical protein LCGC14_1302560 [marine sediment metagenome]|uniref:Uncharacterized protein n=1 Tax=marine sediment metagenome TaxID=412755 RepID=A0A0F9KQG1_9ZZZZ